MGFWQFFSRRQSHRIVRVWASLVAIVGLFAVATHHDPRPAHVSVAGAPHATVPTTVTLPVTIPPTTTPDITVPDVTIPDVTIPTVTLPSLAPPFAPTSQGLWLVDADASSGRLISSATTTNVSFSPDGRQIAMTVQTGRDSDGIETRALQVLDVASGATQTLAPNARIPQAVQWSPDGQWIAYTTLPERNDGGGNSGYLWVIHPDGGGARRLSPSDGGWRLAWSPDSTRISQPQPNLHDVAVVDVASGAVTALPYDNAYLADWLSDGRIVASGLSGTNDTTVVIDPNTSAVSTVVDNGFFSRPSPSGDSVAVRIGHAGGSTGIVPIAGGVVRPLVPGSPIDWSADGTSVTVSDTDMDVTVCDVLTGLPRLAVVGDTTNGWTVSPGPWSPAGRQFLVMVWSYEAMYSP